MAQAQQIRIAFPLSNRKRPDLMRFQAVGNPQTLVVPFKRGDVVRLIKADDFDRQLGFSTGDLGVVRASQIPDYDVQNGDNLGFADVGWAGYRHPEGHAGTTMS